MASPRSRDGRDASGAAGAAGVLTGLAVGGLAYAASDVSTNLFNSHPDHGTPALAGVGAGLASGLLVGALFRGGDANLTPGTPFTVLLAEDVPATP